MIKGFFGAIAALGLFFAVFGVYFIFYGFGARSWPSTEGEVMSARVRVNILTGGTASGRSHREFDRTYYPEITYRWTVDGQVHTGSRWSLGESHPDYRERQEAAAAAADYRTGAPIEVFYDPDDPASAVLDRSLQGGAFVPLPLGLLMLAGGVFGMRKAPAIEAAARRNEELQAARRAGVS